MLVLYMFIHCVNIIIFSSANSEHNGKPKNNNKKKRIKLFCMVAN